MSSLKLYLKFLGFRGLFNIGDTLFTGLFYFVVFFNSFIFFSEDTSFFTYFSYIGYGLFLLFGLILSYNLKDKIKLERTEKKSFFKQIPRFLLFFIPSFIFWIILFSLKVVAPPELLLTNLGNLPVFLLLLNLIVYINVESIVGHRVIDNIKGNLTTCVFFGFLHMFLWSGSLIANFFGAGLLFYILGSFNWYFRKDKFDILPARALHYSFNLVIIILKVSGFTF